MAKILDQKDNQGSPLGTPKGSMSPPGTGMADPTNRNPFRGTNRGVKVPSPGSVGRVSSMPFEGGPNYDMKEPKSPGGYRKKK